MALTDQMRPPAGLRVLVTAGASGIGERIALAFHQRVCAAVVGDVDPAALDAWAHEHLAGHKRPKEYRVVAALPYTATGKLRRRALADGDDDRGDRA